MVTLASAFSGLAIYVICLVSDGQKDNEAGPFFESVIKNTGYWLNIQL